MHEQSTWSTNVYEIHKGGLYADSVLLTSGTIVTPTAVYPGKFHLLLNLVQYNGFGVSLVAQMTGRKIDVAAGEYDASNLL